MQQTLAAEYSLNSCYSLISKKRWETSTTTKPFLWLKDQIFLWCQRMQPWKKASHMQLHAALPTPHQVSHTQQHQAAPVLGQHQAQIQSTANWSESLTAKSCKETFEQLALLSSSSNGDKASGEANQCQQRPMYSLLTTAYDSGRHKAFTFQAALISP